MGSGGGEFFVDSALERGQVQQPLGEGKNFRRAAGVSQRDGPFAALAQQAALGEAAHRLPGGAFAAVEDGGVRADAARDLAAHKGIVGAAHDDGVHRLLQVRPQTAGEDGVNRWSLQLALLDALDEAGAGDLDDLVGRREALHQGGEFLLPEGDLRAHNEDAPAGEALRGQLEGRFDANDDLARVHLAQGLDGGDGSSFIPQKSRQLYPH